MAKAVVNGAKLQCSFGASPSSLVVLPAGRVDAATFSFATIMDHVPNTNIMPFGMCSSLTNPAVASATSAAQGVLTPQPCIPVTSTPWSPGSATVIIGNYPALTDTSICNCMHLGVITISDPGAQTVELT